MKKELFWNLWVPILIGIAMLIYIIVRAAVIPITFDEATTCLTFSVTPIWDIITYKDPIPNNHIVNTLLIKLFTAVFGMHAFVARLPNILGFILYYTVLLIWIRQFSRYSLFILTGIILFTCNPYLIDFFSLARGYALSISFMITSCYFIWRYITGFNLKHHLYAVIFGAIAVYTNFTMLNFYVALCLLIVIIDFQKYRISNRKQLYKLLKQVVVVTIILALLSFYPIYRMVTTDQFKHWGTTGFYTDTVTSLAQVMAYGRDYFNFSAQVWAQVFVYVAFILAFLGWNELRKTKFRLTGDVFPFFTILFIGTIVINVLQFYIAKTFWLTTRTALFYYPLMMVACLFTLRHLSENWTPGFRFISVFIICAGLLHTAKSLNVSSFYEWKFDAHTIEVLNTLEADVQEKNQPLALDVDWLFYPSINFHLVESENKSIQLQNFHFDTDSLSTVDYYYLERKNYNKIMHNFEEVKTFDYGNIILARRKATD